MSLHEPICLDDDKNELEVETHDPKDFQLEEVLVVLVWENQDFSRACRCSYRKVDILAARKKSPSAGGSCLS